MTPPVRATAFFAPAANSDPILETRAEKAQRLANEGVTVRQGAVDLEQFAFRDFTSDRPLERLRRIQEDVQSRIMLRPRRRIPRLAGGVDVAYPRPDVGVAAYALVETATGRLVWSATVRRSVAFPYISTYLSFREIPILLALLDAVRAAGRLAEVLLVDGSGILHHRHAGIASHLGVAASLPTIGVTKKLLCGQVDIREMAPGESRPVWGEGRKGDWSNLCASTRRAGTNRRLVAANCTCPLFSQNAGQIVCWAWPCVRRRAASGRSSFRPAIGSM